MVWWELEDQNQGKDRVGGSVWEEYYWPWGQGERGDEALLNPHKGAWEGQSLTLLGPVNLPVTCWKGSTAGHRQPQRFTQGVRDNFFIQGLNKPAQGVTLMDLLSLPWRRSLVGEALVHGSLGYSEQEKVEMKIRGREGASQSPEVGHQASLSGERAAGIIQEQLWRVKEVKGTDRTIWITSSGCENGSSWYLG